MLRLPTPTPDTPDLGAIRAAFNRLTPDDAARWGRMNPAQMTRHCRIFVELCLGRVPVSWPLRVLARWLAPPLLRRMLRRSPREAPKQMRTLAPLRTAGEDQLDLDDERARLFAALADLEAAADPHHHPLYGAMARADVIALVRHHTAHHLNQFDLLA